VSDIGQQIHGLLSADVDVSALVGTDIAIGRFPGSPPLPGVLVQVVVRGAEGRRRDVPLRTFLLKVTSYGTSSINALVVDQAVREALLGEWATSAAVQIALRDAGLVDIVEFGDLEEDVDAKGPDKGSDIVISRYLCFSAVDATIVSIERTDERNPVLAVGVGTTETPSVASAGAFTFDVGGAPSLDVGDSCFCSEADGSEVEYLGEVASLGDTTVTVEFALASGKSAGWLLWTPVTMFDFRYHVEPVWTFDSGVERIRTLDGVTHLGRVRDEGAFVEFLVSEMWLPDVRDLIAFLRSMGIRDVALGWWDVRTGGARVDTARFIGDLPSFQGASGNVGGAQIPFQIISEGVYPS